MNKWTIEGLYGYHKRRLVSPNTPDMTPGVVVSTHMFSTFGVFYRFDRDDFLVFDHNNKTKRLGVDGVVDRTVRLTKRDLSDIRNEVKRLLKNDDLELYNGSNKNGRKAMTAAMINPLRMKMNYQSLGRKAFFVEPLPEGALPDYGKKS